MCRLRFYIIEFSDNIQRHVHLLKIQSRVKKTVLVAKVTTVYSGSYLHSKMLCRVTIRSIPFEINIE